LPFKDDNRSLQHIHDAIVAIEKFVGAGDLKDALSDERTLAAVERKLLVISEAAVRLGTDAESLCPNQPWREIRGLGNWLRHEYDKISFARLRDIVQNDLPELKAAVEKALHPEESA
jgi:uncharacterized protein with HEPN domain